MKKGTFPSIMIVSLVMLLGLYFSAPLHGIVWCHDYTYYRVTGIDPSPKDQAGQGIGCGVLRDYLERNGYKKFPYANAAARPGAGKRLRSGDVLIIDDAHSGYVTGSDSIDHFIQVFGSSGIKYSINELPRAPLPGNKVGGLYSGDTLVQFLDRRFNKNFTNLEVWRKQ